MIPRLQITKTYKFIMKQPSDEKDATGKSLKEQKEEHFLELDKDGDKIITREEMLEYLHKLEAMKDTDKEKARDPEQTLKEREELVEDIFKSKGKYGTILKLCSHYLVIPWEKPKKYNQFIAIFRH